MIESFAFQTRARTIDHLGREQIADCPTAVSELWKNSYDAYARNVSLNIYDGSPAIATIVDDGHGMNRNEFTDRWLVVGTESKTEKVETSDDDRNGLPIRIKQGQKGIGRLSSASLGPLLLVVSKRKWSPFVAALIDWRLFENPYLFLLDIEIPVVEFSDKSELLSVLPEMFDRLMGNVWGSKSSEKEKIERDKRINVAWEAFSALELSEDKKETTQSKIEKTVIETVFEERHFEEWPLWRGESEQGTLLAVSDIQFDLVAQLSRYKRETDDAFKQAREQLIQTLANFTDPYIQKSERDSGYDVSSFNCRATVWERSLQRRIIEDESPFDLDDLFDLEHVVDGEVNAEGVFVGRIKAFGTWVPNEVVIQPSVETPRRKDSLVGPFHLRIGAFEGEQALTSHSDEKFHGLADLAAGYGGLSVYRDGLRVMPYGREGNDFFHIEHRRTKNAGREFWALRRMFGRVALRKKENPNLRDKAGREGLIDNRAAKTFRSLVENILRHTAFNYFGSNSELRNEIIPDRKEEYKKKKAAEERNKQRTLNRRRFRTKLESQTPLVIDLFAEAEQLANDLRASDLESEEFVLGYRKKMQALRLRAQDLSLGEAPRNLGALEESYLQYRNTVREISQMLGSIADSLDFAMERIKPRSAKEIAYSELSANAAFLHKRIRAWSQEAKGLLNSELARITTIQDERNKAYHEKMLPLIQDLEQGHIGLLQVSEKLEKERSHQDAENAELFESYISTLDSLTNRIDLAALASFSMDQAEELQEEVSRLHALAQLGITVEIIGHEIQALEQTISAGLKSLPDSIKEIEAYQDVKNGHEGLVDRLRFLSPLKLSGPRTRTQISGKAILEYINGFFGREFEREGISLEVSEPFLRFTLVDRPARIYPVFLNLLNNAVYWVNQAEREERKILLDVIDEKVVIADTGPGVDEEDRRNLFKLFFTRKIRGGRGVGLYLCRTNLAAGGHTIEYADGRNGRLPGANFIINFKGAKYA